MTTDRPLIAPKHITEYTPNEYHAYVSDMYELRTKGKAKPTAGVSGLTVSRTKKGALTVRRAKVRPFEYVTMPEIKKLADFYKVSQADLWNVFKQKEYIIAKDRLDAERLYSQLKGIPWEVSN